MKDLIEILDIEPSKDGMTKEYTWLDTKYTMLPNVVGLSLKEAQKELKSFKIEYSGDGEKVIHQSPEAGYYTKENGIVKLLLGD